MAAGTCRYRLLPDILARCLCQNLPAIPGGVPDGLFVYDIPSIVHVLDLAYALALVLATGVLLFRSHPAAPVLAALLVVKMVTLGLALLFMGGFVHADTGRADIGEAVVRAAIVVAMRPGWPRSSAVPGSLAKPRLRARVWP